MRPNDLINLICARYKAGIKRPLYIEGSPGLGKTSLAKQAAEMLGIGFKLIHAPLLQPEDYGFPVINSSRTDADFIVSLQKFPIAGSVCPEVGIFLIDDFAQADAHAQKVLRNLILEREIHGKHIKPGWIIIATGNRTVDRAGSNRLLSHVSNAVTRVTLDVSLDDWTQWAIKASVKPEVIQFLRFKPTFLNAFDPQAEINATPRAWCMGVSDGLGAVPKELEFETFKGDVGEGPASEFLNFLKVYRSLPSIESIMFDPMKAKVPAKGELSVAYAITGALAFRATPDNFGRLMQYMTRLAPEFTVLFVRDAMARSPGIVETKEFINWASSDAGKLVLL